MWDAGTVTKNGVEVQIKVDTEGNWYANVGDQQLAAPTKPELVKKIDKATKRVAQEVTVPFTSVSLTRHWNTGKIVRTVRSGVAYGLHSGNGNVLARWDDNGEKTQLDRYDRGTDTKFVPLTSEEADEYASLYVAQVKAQKAVDEWVKARKIDLRQTVIDALEKGAAVTEE